MRNSTNVLAALKDREYLETLNLKAFQKTHKRTKDQDPKEFFQALQQDAKSRPLFDDAALTLVEKQPKLSKPLTKWLGNLTKDQKEMDKLTAETLNKIVEWAIKDTRSSSVLNKVSTIDDVLAHVGLWIQEPDLDKPHSTNKSYIADLGGGFRIIELGPEDLKREGELMQNCLKDGNYDDNFSDPDYALYSLIDGKGLPHADIELYYGNVGDVFGKQNQPPVGKYSDILEHWFVSSSIWSGILKLPEAKTKIPDDELLKLLSDEEIAMNVVYYTHMTKELMQKVVDKLSMEPNMSFWEESARSRMQKEFK